MPPLVSIIVPVYQVSDYVERCLKSVMNQTYRDIECIIVDDATKDDSVEKCEKLIADYQGGIRFVILHHEQNRGLSAARNTGTDVATGDYLYYLDSDDEITSNCIEKLVSYVIDDDNIEMVQGRYLRKEDGKEVLGKSDEVRILSNDEARVQYLAWRSLNYAVWNKLLKRSFVLENKLYNREGLLCEDLLWNFYLIKYLSNAQLCDEVTYYYHIRPGSILTGSGKAKLGQSNANIFDEILHHLTPGKERDELKGYQTTFCTVLAKYFRCTPVLKPVLRVYQKSAKQYGCQSVYYTISAVALVSRFGNPMGLLSKLYELRGKLMKR